VTSWFEVIFNPSFPYRLTHMLLASGLTVAFLVAGVSAYRWLRGDRRADVQAALRTGIYLAALLIPLQIVAGDAHGLNTLEYQPAKVAAMEGLWKTEKGAPAVLFALPDSQARKNHYEIAIPKLASIYLTHEVEGEVKGLDDFVGKHPPVGPVFWAFRIMVGVGMLMLLVSWASVFQLKPWKKTGADEKNRELTVWHARVLLGMTFAGWVALIAGWYVTEIGRQPWLVSGLLLAVDAQSAVPAPQIALTLTLYLLLYAALIVSYIGVVFYLARHVKRTDLEDQLNVVNYPQKEKSPQHV
jgi:cytochrome d ubiquinol oxidase subunit I